MGKNSAFLKNLPEVKISGGKVYCTTGGASREWGELETSGNWVLMKCLEVDGAPVAVVEDFSEDGGICYLSADGKLLHEFPKRLESTNPGKDKAYLGYPKNVVLGSNADIMGKAILARPEDPNYDSIKPCVPPVRESRSGEGEAPHTFIGTMESADVIPLYYGVWTGVSRLPGGYVAPEMDYAVGAQTISEGLYGGWLPIVVMRYPVEEGVFWEKTSFARTNKFTPTIQSAWYRYIKIQNGKVADIRYFDSFMPFPISYTPDESIFYSDLLHLQSYWDKALEGGMDLKVSAEPWVRDFCKHSMVLDMITRTGDHPHYGVVVRHYGAEEHDGFQDILTAGVSCYLEWGKTDKARAYMKNYLDYFVRDNGLIEYRGPELGQYARTLTLLGQYYDYTGDASLALECEFKILGITNLLMDFRTRAKELPEQDPAYGMLCGYNEADSAFGRRNHDVYDYKQPYFSNSTEAWRGFRDLGAMWRKIGEAQNNASLIARGAALEDEAAALYGDIMNSLERSVLTDRGGRFMPIIAGTKEYYYDYPYAATPDSDNDNRVWSEMMHSGLVPKAYIDLLLEGARIHNGMRLGIFGNRSSVVAFICYGEAYGFIQHDMIRELLMFYYAHALHLHSRGTWTAYECVDLDRDRSHNAGFCTPAQLTIPTVTKWMLVFEDPLSETLWLCKATPREWLADGESISVQSAPTRWGTVHIEARSHIAEGFIAFEANIPKKAENVILRLRTPDNKTISSVSINGAEIAFTLADPESIIIPGEYRGKLSIKVSY